jgi:hypothetical protein
LKRVYSSFNLAAVHHARNVLETEGIRAVVKNEFLSSAMGDLPPAECQAEVWVLRDQDAERAIKVILEPRGGGEPWTCENCREPREAQFTQCWRCGTFRAS